MNNVKKHFSIRDLENLSGNSKNLLVFGIGKYKIKFIGFSECGNCEW